MPHAVARLRAERLARSTKPFLSRGGIKGIRCEGCRLPPVHCMCPTRAQWATQAGFCLIMADIEPIKPSNKGWLIADVVHDTHAFGWSRSEVQADLLVLLANPQWQPVVVFPGEYASSQRVTASLPAGTQRPLFVLLDGTWPEARKMFRKSPYLDDLPVLSLAPDHVSRYRLRRSRCDEHLCTAEVAAYCLALAGENAAADALDTRLEDFTQRYLKARQGLGEPPLAR